MISILSPLHHLGHDRNSQVMIASDGHDQRSILSLLIF